MAFESMALAELAAKPSISALDVVRLHDALTYDGPIREDEALALFAIELADNEKHPGWKDFFIDAIGEYTIHHCAPHGYLTAHKADWLLRQSAPAGRVLTRNIFSMLITLVAVARWVPERLISALFDEVYCAVGANNGPLRERPGTMAGSITPRDCDVVRHVLYSAGTSGHRTITRVEAEGLLAINSAITSEEPCSAWTELFCRAIGDAVLAAGGYTGPTREVFLCPDWDGVEVCQLKTSLHRGMDRYRPQATEDGALGMLERQRISIITGDDVGLASADWLAQALTVHASPPSTAVALLMAILSERDFGREEMLSLTLAPEQTSRAA